MPIDLTKILKAAEGVRDAFDHQEFVQMLRNEAYDPVRIHKRRQAELEALEFRHMIMTKNYPPPSMPIQLPMPSHRETAPIVPHNHYRAGIRAWRAWNVTQDGILRSVSMSNVRWTGPQITADQLPEHSNDRGIYAVKLTHALKEYETSPVEGEVLLYGRVLIFEQGYRAQHAMIKSLRIFPSRLLYSTNSWWDCKADELADILERTYGCDVEICDAPGYSEIKREVANYETPQNDADHEEHIEAWKACSRSVAITIPTFEDYCNELRKADRNR